MGTRAAPTAGAPVDWAVAARIAGRLVPPGPATGRAEADALVTDLHRSAAVAETHVTDVTGLVAGRPLSRVLVVDRGAWARANTQMLAALTDGVPFGPGDHRPSTLTRAAGGVQIGTVLAMLSGRVLGQFDPFSPRTPAGGAHPDRGRLLLVAPNVLRIERLLRVDPRDFRLWVALHEQTHALQFAAAPWLEDHLRARMAVLLRGLVDDDGASGGAGAALTRAVQTVRRPPAAPDGGGRGRPRGTGPTAGGSGLAVMLPERTREALDEVGAVMALLEGHADVAMDAVGRSVVPSVRQIRTRFDRRRAGSHGVVSVVLRRVLGLDVKLAQYRDGARFVRRVRRSVGVDGLNAVWSDPRHLPTPQEIREPRSWVRRVHG